MGPWIKIPTASTGRLRELANGHTADVRNDVQSRMDWEHDLYFAIRCEEPLDSPLNRCDPQGW